MKFEIRKFPLKLADKMRRVPIKVVSPYAMMLAPVYVMLKHNEKFISVKSPLDFFSEAELQKLKSYNDFYLPPFLDTVTPFTETAKRIKMVLAASYGNKADGAGKYLEVIAPAPYEISDAILRILGPLWSSGGMVEPFFVTIFINELCDPLSGELLERARNAGVDHFEYSIMLADWVAFLAMHLGYLDNGFINRLRNSVFEFEVFGKDYHLNLGAEIQELHEEARLAFPAIDTQVLLTDFFWSRDTRVSQKLSSKLLRVKQEMIKAPKKGEFTPSIFGEKGFAGE